MSEPWTDAAAARPDALFSRFVCRVSGAPADTVDGLRAERALAHLRELAAVEARLHRRREEVSDLLYAAIGAAADKPARNRLITLKRELYNLRAPGAEKLENALAGADAATGEAVRGFVADLHRAAALEDEVRAAHDAELAAHRGAFRELVRDPDFRKGLMVSTRALYGNLERYRAAAASGDLSGRDEKTERGLLRYYTRMAEKATPFATFCAIIPGAFTPAADGDAPRIRFRGDPRAKRSFVRINKFLYGLLFDHLKTRPAVRRALAVERNPTLRAEEGRLVYLTAVEGREVFQRLADNEVLQLIASRFRPGVEPTLGDLIAALSADPEIEATPEEAEAYLDRLIEIGFLRFHTGIREQDADWDLPFRALLDRIDDDHARQSSALLASLRDDIREYTDAPVERREQIVDEIHQRIEDALSAMEIDGRLRRDMPFYEDATAEASAEVPLTPGVRRAFDAFEEWVRITSRLAWPRNEQATMRHFFQDYYGSAEGVPLLKFYEDFYREHFKAHVEKEGKLRAGQREGLEGYDLGNPFGLDSVRLMGDVRTRLQEVMRARWEADPDAEVLDLSAGEVEEALAGVETRSGVPRSMGAFALLAPPEGEGDDPSFILHGASYTAGYGKYFSRFLYMLPDDVQEDVRQANAALTGEMLAEICGDAQFNANLHPPLMKWEISYPTGESGATEQQLRSSEILVEPDPEDPDALRLRHGPTGARVIPVDLGFLNPRMRPPLYQLLSRFTPPVMWAPPIPESPVPQPKPAPKPEEGAVAADADAGPGTTDEAGPGTTDEAGPGTTDEAAAAPADAHPGVAEAQQGEATPPPPPPTVSVRPRITYRGNVILTRRRWSVPMALFPQRRPDESAADFFLRANRWRAEHGIPEAAYLRINPLPEPRPRQAGQPAPADTPAEAPADDIPGYEGAAEAHAHDEEHDEPDTPADAQAAAEGEPGADGADGAAKAAEAQKKRTQPSRDWFKPQFVDFGNPLLVGLLGRVASGLKNFSAVFEERVPGPAALPEHDGHTFVTELVVQLYFPGGTAAAPAPAAALAGSAS